MRKHNELRADGTILIFYDEIMKNIGLSVLKVINRKYKKQFGPLLNLDLFKFPDKDLIYLYSARIKKNPLEWIATQEFDYELNYENIRNKFDDLYIFTPPTNFAKKVDKFLDEFSVKKIIFVSEEYDNRIDFDIQHTYHENKNFWKIEYVTGSMVGILKEYTPDIIFYPYLDENILSLAKEYPKIVFAFPNYGFNTLETKDANNIGFFPAIIQSGPVFLG